jgi:diaminopimelate decarboxylase
VIDKTLPFSHELLEEIAEQYGTPVFVYNEEGIRHNAQRLLKAFSFNKDHKNFFAVKATPTPGILRIIHDEKMGFDCSSRGELEMIDQENLTSNGIFYSSNNTPDDDYRFANNIGATINVDKLPYVQQVREALGGQLPARMAIRYNPGSQHSGNGIIGKPEESKFGDTAEHVLTALAEMKNAGVSDLGLHAMVASNEKSVQHFATTARLLRELAERAQAQGCEIAFINVGGGLGVNYKDDEEPVDVEGIGQAVQSELGALDIPIYTEHGRFITGPHGYLLTRVTHGIIETYEPYVEIDSSINNMARLATVTAAYHHINILGRDGDPKRKMNVTGSLCANTDKMFKMRELPETIQPGDLMVIQDAGAHSRANSHNYNFRLRAGEVLVHPDGTHSLIRRHERVDDLFATTAGL